MFPTAHRRTTRRLLSRAAALPVCLYAAGIWESRSGGHLLVADAFDRPILLISCSLALLVLAACFMKPGRDRIVATLFTVLVWITVMIGGVLLQGLRVTETMSREQAPDRPDRALVVRLQADPGGETESQYWSILVEAGTGWCARRWTVHEMAGQYPGYGAFKSATWTGPDRITVTTDMHVKVFSLSAGDGHPLPAPDTP
ncbi:hypothetical protein [Kitasatospora sp. NPDC002965]|uniref:hypothetical protein n=1 Tax=Kitasatospora sp. NPDC002965 TaxID=3154775 RepID=UPI0033A27FF7